MQHDIRPSEIDCVFCWRTSTGEVAEGARDSAFNGAPVPYRPDGRRMVEGLRTNVRGHSCAHRPTGFRLDEQGGISRMCAFVAGYVTRASLVPARDARELEILRDAARAAVLSGDAGVWALGTIHAGEREWLAIHIGADSSIVASLARRVQAPWTVDIEERIRDGSSQGSELRFRDSEGGVLETLDGDTLFDEEPLPPIAAFERGERHARDASFRDILAYVGEFKRSSREKARRDMPWMTEAQLEAGWEFASQLFGLEVPKRKPGR